MLSSWVKQGNLKLIFTLGNWATIGHWFMNRQWWMIPQQLCPHWPKQALYCTNTLQDTIKNTNTNTNTDTSTNTKRKTDTNFTEGNGERWLEQTCTVSPRVMSINQQRMQILPTQLDSSSSQSLKPIYRNTLSISEYSNIFRIFSSPMTTSNFCLSNIL